MRISDWSSDVCYSDLDQHLALAEKLRLQLVDRAVQRLVLARLLVGRGLRIVGIVENGLARHVGHGFNPLYLWTWWSDADGSFPSAGLVGPTNRWILWSDSSQGRPTQRASRLQALQEPSDQAAPELVLQDAVLDAGVEVRRSEEHTSELPSLMRISYAVFCLKKNKQY